ncbi:hypothetical protein HK100_000466 [Physocladia obscura]|uniref:C2 NT-type domain-containing protein n=1 Tax=Physocladia obscura TaxID=109957 RepID=A0AAD5T0W3_9FUNG|nr:hypothetical protein HK100_000466 [Physocladia obscura]
MNKETSASAAAAAAAAAKKRSRLGFACECIVHELNNLPYVSGFYYVKWRIHTGIVAPAAVPSSAAGGYSGTRGVTHRATVRDHTVVWNALLSSTNTVENNNSNNTTANAGAAADQDPQRANHGAIDLSIGTDRDGLLAPCELILVVKQEANGGRDAETVGSVAINLSDLAGFQQQMQAPTTVRRFLLHESKLNATLKVSISMKLVRGSPSDFVVPPMQQQHTAGPHRSGIAGGSGAGGANGMGGQDTISMEAIRDVFTHNNSSNSFGSHSTGIYTSRPTNINNIGSSANFDQYHHYHNPRGGGSGFGAPRLSSTLSGSLGDIYRDLKFYDDSEDIQIVDEIFDRAVERHRKSKTVNENEKQPSSAAFVKKVVDIE